jgi:hypothetical protein
MSNNEQEDQDRESGSACDRDYVGYRSPPYETRFKRGRSGNPRGRPKRRRSQPSPEGLFLEETKRTVFVREGERVIEKSACGVMMAQLTMKALRGDIACMRQIFETLDEAKRRGERLGFEDPDDGFDMDASIRKMKARLRELQKEEKQAELQEREELQRRGLK